jgi:proteasome activator subunit 4
MKRELVKALRTVSLLAIFSENSNVVSQIQGTLKSMCVMEPDLILHPILERAIPSLETLVEVCFSPVFVRDTREFDAPFVSRQIERLLLSRH